MITIDTSRLSCGPNFLLNEERRKNALKFLQFLKHCRGLLCRILQLRPHYTVHTGGWRMTLIEFQVFFQKHLYFENIAFWVCQYSSYKCLITNFTAKWIQDRSIHSFIKPKYDSWLFVDFCVFTCFCQVWT